MTPNVEGDGCSSYGNTWNNCCVEQRRYKNNVHLMSCVWFQSVISVVFRDEKSVKDSLQLHEFWHSRQHSAKQRILDIGQLTCVFMMNINNNTNITITICAS